MLPLSRVARGQQILSYSFEFNHAAALTLRATKREGLKEVPLVVEADMDDERAFAMMKRENSESYGVNAASDAGVIAGLIAGYVDGRLMLNPVHSKTPPYTIYLARRGGGNLQIIGPGGREVEEAMSLHTTTTFTAYALAEHLGWTHAGTNREAGTQPSRRFYAAFKALTELILPGAATPSEREGLNQRTINDVAEGVDKVGGEATKERQMAETKAALTGRATKREGLGMIPRPSLPVALTPRTRGRDAVKVAAHCCNLLNPTHARARRQILPAPAGFNP